MEIKAIGKWREGQLRVLLNSPFFYIALVSFILLLLEWKTILTSPKIVGTDFSIYYSAAKGFLDDPLSLYPAMETGFDQFLYPPPSVVIFVTLSFLPESVAYYLFIFLMYVCLFIAMLLWLRLSRNANLRLRNFEMACIIPFAMASSASYHNVSLGQVNCLVLLLGVLYIFLYSKYPMAAGLILSLAIWIKIYPIFLLILAVQTKEGRLSALGCALGGIIVPLLLQPVVPFTLYPIFVSKILDISHYASAHIINQSLSAFSLRFTIPFSSVFIWPNLYVIPFWIKLINYAFLICIVLFTLIRLRKTELAKSNPQLILAAILLSLSALFSPLGWGHTYVFCIPLWVISFGAAKELFSNRVFFFLIVLFAMVCLIPVYNVQHMLDSLPFVIQNLFYSRLLLITLFCIFLVLRIHREIPESEVGIRE